MPSWWGKSSSKDEKKKANKESFIDTIHRKLKIASDEKSNGRSGGSRRRCSDTISERGSQSRVPSRSPSPSKHVSRCQSFVERPHAQPLPLPRERLGGVGRTNSGISGSTRPGFNRGSKPLVVLPLPKPECVSNRLESADVGGDLAAASVSSGSSTNDDDPSDSHLPSTHTLDYENGNRTAAGSPSGIKLKDHLPIGNQRISREPEKPDSHLLNRPILSTSPKRAVFGNHVQNIQIPHQGAFCSAPDSSMSSPSRSPMRAFGAEQALNSGLWIGKPFSDIALMGSGQSSSPGSGYNSGHNSVGGDMSGQMLWPQSRCSPECSPIPSPRMTSPGPSSRIHSGAVTPQHPRAGGGAPESPASQHDEGKQRSHRLPLPPITISNTCPFSPAYSAATSPSIPKSPGRAESPTCSGSCWKKGRLLGRGTFGHVYLGFNSESGEMCAMKEVTLFSNDAKSKESAQQLIQEISLLSRLRHSNIVQYYGSENVDDTLYIYLEYVSGGSIYKLLQEYGQFGEIAIRNYTQQILCGLAYLHAKNTVHRDIKGSNILVDPNGRVKLADFGMAKHITGQSCPLSLKGSPYWMAPEVIKNTNGCGLAVDIWSLGCTVLEMATTKPPWSQYEWVPAMFKIGNSKELPSMPDNLSDEGKDFVRQCLQRNPLHRPTAVQLLEHPFVKNAAPLERSICTAEHSDASPAVVNATRMLGIGRTGNVPCYENEMVSNCPSRSSKTGSAFSDAHTPRNMSCPVSPIGSPLLRSRSPQHMSGGMSPSPISSPHTASGSSTPLSGGSGAIPSHHSGQAITFLHENVGRKTRPQNTIYGNAGASHPESKPDLFRGISQASHVFQDWTSSDNGYFGVPFGVPGPGKQLVLADHVSQQLLKDHLKMKPSVELNPSSSMLGHNSGI